MKVPLSWLREYVDFDDSASGLAEKLTFSGIEVEGISPVREGLDKIIVGRIVSIEKHPGADKLKICLVSDGRETVRVVCGADNMKPGDKSAFAPCGSILPSGTKIKRTKIRGEESSGMLCAEDELNLSDDHSGIIILDPSLEEGTPLSRVFGERDEVLDLEITWNRPDCLSIIGIAREVAALYGTKLRIPEVELKEDALPAADVVSVSVEDRQACPRYIGRYLTGIRVGPSPLWMKARLASCGLRPINNVVDITNYVLLETGHPLHAFDYRQVEGGGIKVRYASDREKISTLDGVERKLNRKILVIADKTRPLAVAGVMGGDGSQIEDSTTEVLLESAAFFAPVIHTAVAGLGIATESSHRFERGVDFDGVDYASRRAAGLICDLAGGRVAAGCIDSNVGAPAVRKVRLSMADLSAVIGVEISSNDASKVLTSLGFSLESVADGFDVSVPPFRPDIEIQADLIEEVARIRGLDSVPALPPVCSAVAGVDDSISWNREHLRDSLVALGLMEVVNYSFTSPKLAALTASFSTGLVLPNPVSSDYSVMRGALAAQMTDLLGRNLAHQQQNCACFEIGKVFEKQPEGQFTEHEHLCIGLMGKAGRYAMDRVAKARPEEVFLWGKGIIQSIFSMRNISFVLNTFQSPLLEPGTAVQISEKGGAVIGWMGLLSGAVRSEYRMLEPVLLAEIGISGLISRAEHCPQTRPVPAYPFMMRDIAIVVNESVSNGDIVSAIAGINCQYLTQIELFDIFRGEGFGTGRKSMAYSLKFQAFDKTLTDMEVNKFRDQVRDVLKNKLDAEIREG